MDSVCIWSSPCSQVFFTSDHYCDKMRVHSLLFQAASLLLACQSTVSAASWGFTDATLTVQGKGAGVGSGLKEK